MPFTAIFIIVMVLAISFFVFMVKRSIVPQKRRHMKYFKEVTSHSIPGEAKIIKIRNIQNVQDRNDYFMDVEITPSGGESYILKEITKGWGRWPIRLVHADMIKEGAILPVVIHPSEREYIYFQFEIEEIENLKYLLISPREEYKARVKLHTVLKEEILKNGRKGEATVVHARVVGEFPFVENRSLLTGQFNIRLWDTGEEYVLNRKELAIPSQKASDFKCDTVMPVLVHKDNPQIVMFEFDKSSAPMDMKLVD